MISGSATEQTYRFRSVKSAVPGRALKLSAAPPTTIVIAEPGPACKIFEQLCLLTTFSMLSRYRPGDHAPHVFGTKLWEASKDKNPRDQRQQKRMFDLFTKLRITDIERISPPLFDTSTLYVP